tara:strand:- start:250 stop:453 length:204 start_codon:yes stop_codon:yes gene_type:complete
VFITGRDAAAPAAAAGPPIAEPTAAGMVITALPEGLGAAALAKNSSCAVFTPKAYAIDNIELVMKEV